MPLGRRAAALTLSALVLAGVGASQADATSRRSAEPLAAPASSEALRASAVAQEQTPEARGRWCVRADRRDIAGLFDRWNASLATGDPATVVRRNYARDSVLLATLSNRPRVTPAQQRDYFAGFLKNKPSGRIVERHIDIDCRTAVDTGLYTFTYGTDGTLVPARYTFTYRWIDGSWRITSHHSSMMPEKPGQGGH